MKRRHYPALRPKVKQQQAPKMTDSAIGAMRALLQLGKMMGADGGQIRNFIAANYTPQVKQLEFHIASRECDESDGPVMVGFGGARGPGKSHAAMAQVALDDCIRSPGLKALFLRSIKKAARESFQDLIRKVCHSVDVTFKPSKSILYFPNGSQIVLGGFRRESDIETYLGIEYGLIVVEEATLLSKSRWDMLRGSLRTARVGWRPRLYASTNPGGVGHGWFRKLFILPARAHDERDTRFIFANARDNAFINKEYLEYLESLDGLLRKMWLDGAWDLAAGQFFTEWSHGRHVKTFSPGDFNHQMDWWAALDYGYTHYTVCLLGCSDGDGNHYIVGEHARQRWSTQEHAAAIHEMLAVWGQTVDTLDTFVAGRDVFARRHEDQTIAGEYEKHGISLSPANVERVNGAARLTTLLGRHDADIAPKLFINESCTLTVEQMPLMVRDPVNPEAVRKANATEAGEGGDDAFDCLRYWARVSDGPDWSGLGELIALGSGNADDTPQLDYKPGIVYHDNKGRKL